MIDENEPEPPAPERIWVSLWSMSAHPARPAPSSSTGADYVRADIAEGIWQPIETAPKEGRTRFVNVVGDVHTEGPVIEVANAEYHGYGYLRRIVFSDAPWPSGLARKEAGTTDDYWRIEATVSFATGEVCEDGEYEQRMMRHFEPTHWRPRPPPPAAVRLPRRE